MRAPCAMEARTGSQEAPCRAASNLASAAQWSPTSHRASTPLLLSPPGPPTSTSVRRGRGIRGSGSGSSGPSHPSRCARCSAASTAWRVHTHEQGGVEIRRN